MGDLLKYFNYSHLPEDLQNISKPFYDLAINCATLNVSDYEELKAGLHLLLQAKDCVVRAALDTKPVVPPVTQGKAVK